MPFFILFLLFEAPLLRSQVEMVVRNDIVECGEEFTVEIYANNFEDIFGIQFTLAFDPDMVEFVSISNSLPPNALFDFNDFDDYLLVTYATFNSMTYPDGTVIFEVVFNHIGECGDPFIIHLVDDPVQVEVSSFSGPVDHLIFGAVFLSESACDPEVDAGEDQFVCEAGDLVDLQGEITGEYFDFFWEPDDQVTEPDQLSTAAVVPETTVFTLTARKETENIVYNTHFDFGYAGFYSDYEYNDTDLSGGNAFAVANSPDIVYSNFPFCSDHTGNNGNMLIVNGVGAPPQNAWCQYMEVEEGTDYLLGAFINTLTSFLFPQAELQFQINGEEVGAIFDVPDIPCFSSWEEMNAIWTADQTGTIDFCIFNHQGNVNPVGNGFIVDDISFIPLCRVEDEVEVELKGPAEVWIEATICAIDGFIEIAGQAYTSATEDIITIERPDDCDSIIYVEILELELNVNIETPEILSCDNTTVAIDASSSTSGPEVEYNWSTPNGNIVSGQGTPVITVDQPGTYTLVLFWEDGELSCFSEEVTVVVLQDIDSPEIEITGDSVLNCENDFLEMVANVTPPGTYDYLWSTADGNITGSNQFSFVLLDAEGTYLVEVINPVNGCSSIDSVLITGDYAAPLADAGPDVQLNCVDSVFWLGSANSSLGNNFHYSWTTQHGNIISNADSLFIEADQSGVYVLQILNSENGCFSVDSATIEDDRIFPEINALPFSTLNCLNDSLWIGFELVNTGMDFTVIWTTVDGVIVSSPDSLWILVSEVGTYEIELAFEETGCAVAESIGVEGDTEYPNANAGPGMTLNCINSEVTLDGSSSSSGGTFSYSWTTVNGNITNGQNQPNPVVDASGWYFLEVLNSANGCVDIDSVWVESDLEAPELAIEGDVELNCTLASGSLNAIVVNGGDYDITFNWITTGGNILGSVDSSVVHFDQSGAYTVEVTFDQNGCYSEEMAIVSENYAAPEIDSFEFSVLTCALNESEVIVHTELPNTDLNFQWTGPAGGISGSDSLSTIITTVPGWYVVTVGDPQNGCESTDSVFVPVDTVAPSGEIVALGTLNCLNDQIELMADFAPIGEFDYDWSSQNGNIVSGGNENTVIVDSAGIYQLVVTSQNNACSDTLVIELMEDDDPPVADAGPDMDLNCEISELNLDGSGTSGGSGYIYSWTTPDGNIMEGDSTLEPLINQAGMYILTVLNSNNGCASMDSVTVHLLDEAPEIAISGDSLLTCDLVSGSLIVDVLNGAGMNPNYFWTTPNGNIVGPADSSMVDFDAAGTYFVEVVFDENGCSSVEEFTVGIDVNPPEIDSFSGAILNCNFEEAIITVMTSDTTVIYNFSWSGPAGGIVSGNNSADIIVTEAGWYSVEILNPSNGCFAIDSVFVASDFSTPEAEVFSNGVLTCANTEVEIFVDSDSTHNLSYSWFTLDGNITGPMNQSSTTADESGTYSVVVISQENGCLDTFEITVESNFEIPLAHAGQDTTWNCGDSLLVLDGGSSSVGPDFIYNWTADPGIISGPADLIVAEILGPGTYTIEVLNSENGCSASDTVVVLADQDLPQINMIQNVELTCDNEEGWIGFELEQEEPFSAVWTTMEGEILSNFDSLWILVGGPGEYVVSVTLTSNNCNVLESVLVGQNTELPLADAGSDSFIGCDSTIVVLDGSNSSSGPGFIYRWWTANGNILGGDSSIIASADQPGLYFLEVTDTGNGCSALDSMEIAALDELPVFSISGDSLLTCSDTELKLFANMESTSFTPEFEWFFEGNPIIGPGNQDTINASQPGLYELNIAFVENQCSNTVSIQVQIDTFKPEFNLISSGIITCFQSTTELTALVSNSTDNYSFQWTGPVGATLDPDDRDSISVDSGGWYFLTLTNTNTGCTGVDSIEVLEDIQQPAFTLFTSPVSGCGDQTGLIEVFFDSESDYSFEWSTENGNITSFNNADFILTDTGGLYRVLVTNNSNGCVSPDSIELLWNVLPLPAALAGPDLTFFCGDSILVLDGSGSDIGIDFVYNWTTSNGSIEGGANSLYPIVNSPGLYILEVTNTHINCSSFDSVEVVADDSLPEIVIESSGQLNCEHNEVILDASGSDSGPGFSGVWRGSAPFSVLDSLGRIIAVTGEGAYFFELENTNNGCAVSQSVTVEDNTDIPVADAGSDITTGCSDSLVFISAVVSAENPSLQYFWTASEGEIFSKPDSTGILAGAEGVFVLNVLNTENGCNSTDTVRVLRDVELPEVYAGSEMAITCSSAIILLDGSMSDSGTEFSVSWTTVDGNILSGANSLRPEVDSEGTYLLTITNLVNGCSNRDSVNVTTDTLSPVINAMAGDELNCRVINTTLIGSVDGNPDDYSIQWTTVDGNILEGSETLTPLTNQAGVYTLVVTDLENGCVATDSTTVEINTADPIFELTGLNDLNCANPESEIGVNLLSGSDVSYYLIEVTGDTLESNTSGEFKLAQPGAFSILLIDGENYCKADTSFMVFGDFVSPEVSIECADCDPCNPLPAVLFPDLISSSGPVELDWIYNENDARLLSGDSIELMASTTVSLHVYDLENGCSDTLEYQYEALELIFPTFSVQNIDCNKPQGGIFFQEVDGFLYSIDGGDTYFSGGSFDNLPPGDFDLSVRFANSDCESEITQVSIQDFREDLLVFLPTEVDLEFGESFRFVPTFLPDSVEIVSYNWIPGNILSCSDCPEPVVTNWQQNEEVELTVVSSGGCIGSAAVRLRVIVSESRDIFIPNAFSPNSDGINDRFVIYAGPLITEIELLEIYDRWGSRVFHRTHFPPNSEVHSWDGTYKGEEVAPAVFTVKVQYRDQNGNTQSLLGELVLVR